jgi:hypothetical protein
MHPSFDQARTYFEARLGRSLPAREKVPVNCPFPPHEDRNPSATLFLDDNPRFYCNGCGLNLSMVEFEMRMAACDEDSAQKNIAELTGAALNGSRWKLEAKYTYRDAEGVPVSQKWRYRKLDGKKTFVWYRRDGAGKWQKDLADDTPRLLYNLPEIICASLVLFVEGEKVGDALSALIPKLWPKRQANGLRIAVTTNPEGAWKPGEKPKWRVEYNKYFGGKSVVIFEDNDLPGGTLADHVASQVCSVAERVRRIGFPGMSEKYDVADWIGEHSADPRQLVADLQRMIESAPLYHPAESPDPCGPVGGDGFRLQPIGELLAHPETPPDYLVDGLLIRGTVSCVVSKPKVGKSTFARGLCLAVATGQPFLGLSTHPGACMYLALEERREEITSDFRAMGAGSADRIEVHAEAAPALAILALIDLVRKQRPALVVIDPLFRLAHIRDEKAYAEVYGALGPLIDLARETDTHILLTHHSGKSPKADPIDSPLGSTAIGGASATTIVLTRRESYRTIQTVTRIGPTIPETVLSFDAETRLLSMGGTRAEADCKEMESEIIEHLKEAAKEQTEAEIVDRVEGRHSNKRKALRSLLEKGMVSRTATGKRGDPFKYSYSCTQPISGTRVQETQNGPQPRVSVEEKLVPADEQNPILVPDEKDALLGVDDAPQEARDGPLPGADSASGVGQLFDVEA